MKSWRLNLLMFFLIFPLLSGNRSISAEMLAFYPLDQNLVDYSGNQKDGIMHGTAVYIKDRLEYDEKAIQLNGLEDYLKLPVGKYPNLAISVWLKPDRGMDSAIIFDYGKKKFYSQIDAVTSATNPAFYVEMYYPGLAYFKSANTLWMDEWHHLYVDSGNGQQGPRVFIDGYLSKEIFSKFPLQAENGDLLMGRLSDSNMNKAKMYGGAMDDIRVYNRPLSGVEVLAEYAKNLIGVEKNKARKTFCFISRSEQKLHIQGHELLIGGVEIYSVSGQLLWQSPYQPVIDVSTLEKGMILIKLLDHEAKAIYVDKEVLF
jgi:hypothetical protein